MKFSTRSPLFLAFPCMLCLCLEHVKDFAVKVCPEINHSPDVMVIKVFQEIGCYDKASDSNFIPNSE
jgi:hypothetical protein